MDFNHTDDGHTQVEAADESPPLGVGNMAEPRRAGPVEISDEATLEDLKAQVAY